MVKLTFDLVGYLLPCSRAFQAASGEGLDSRQGFGDGSDSGVSQPGGRNSWSRKPKARRTSVPASRFFSTSIRGRPSGKSQTALRATRRMQARWLAQHCSRMRPLAAPEQTIAEGDAP